MTSIIAQPPVIRIPSMSVEERVSHISLDMIYDERELAFFKVRDEVIKRSLERDRKFLDEGWAFIERLKKEQLEKEQNSK